MRDWSTARGSRVSAPGRTQFLLSTNGIILGAVGIDYPKTCMETISGKCEGFVIQGEDFVRDCNCIHFQ
jgi:hypothetical protein